MSTHPHISILCYVALAVTFLTTVLLVGLSPIAADESGFFTASDLNANWDTSNAVQILLSDSGSTVNGTGAYAHGNDVYIVSGGQYLLSGTLFDGSVVIDAAAGEPVFLMLCGVSIHCSDAPAILVEQADHVFLTLADQSGNTLSSGAEYGEAAVTAGIDATV